MSQIRVRTITKEDIDFIVKCFKEVREASVYVKVYEGVAESQL